MEDVVDFPFPRQGEFDGERRNNLLDLEEAMIFVVQLPRWSAGFDVPAVEHNEVADLVHGCLPTIGVYVPAHSLLCCVQTLPGLFSGILLAGLREFAAAGLVAMGWNP
jgi:hypothetical protein